MTGTLQQPPAFRPFPGEFLPLALIALFARKNEVTYVIGGDICSCYSTQRIGMFDVIDVSAILALLKLREAAGSIVAAMLLMFQLLLNLVRGVRSLHSPLSDTSDMLTYTMSLLYFRTVCILLAVRLHMFLYIRTAHVGTPIDEPLLLYFRTTSVLTYLLFSLWALIIQPYPFLYIRTLLVVFGIGSCAFLYFWTITVVLEVGASAYFALSLQSIFPDFFPIEKFSCSRMPLLAFRTCGATFERGIFRGYNRIHSYLISFIDWCSLGLICASNTFQAVFCFLHYSTNPPLKQVQRPILQRNFMTQKAVHV